MTFYKVLNVHDRPIYGTGTWHLPHGKRPGKWMPVVTPVVPCESGYHLCDGLADLLVWLGPNVYEAEGRGEMVRDGSKTVFAQARVLRRVDAWNEATGHLFAADCAERVLPIFEAKRPGDGRPRRAIEAARAFARGEIAAVALAAARDAAWAAFQDAARDAAWAAAGDAAWAAAGDAAWVAARVAAWVAARAAARAAARVAAWDAARVAAWDAERSWQVDRLAQYLRGEVE